MKKGLTNEQAGDYARALIAFETKNRTLFGHDCWSENEVERLERHKIYTVFSYGTHFPIYAWCYESEKWIGNRGKYSPTTAKHQKVCKPKQVDMWVDAENMRRIVSAGGLPQYIAERLETA